MNAWQCFSYHLCTSEWIFVGLCIWVFLCAGYVPTYLFYFMRVYHLCLVSRYKRKERKCRERDKRDGPKFEVGWFEFHLTLILSSLRNWIKIPNFCFKISSEICGQPPFPPEKISAKFLQNLFIHFVFLLNVIHRVDKFLTNSRNKSKIALSSICSLYFLYCLLLL